MSAARMERFRGWAHGVLWISPWLIGTVVFLLVPAAMSAYYSFTDYSLLERPVGIGWANFAELGRDAVFWRAVRNTAVFAAGTVGIGTVLSVAIAALLEAGARGGRPRGLGRGGAGVVRAIVFLPTVVPVVAASIGWMWLYNGNYGLLNRMLGAAGIAGPDWLGDGRWALASLVLMQLWFIGSSVVVCTAAMRQVPSSLYEAAAVDGMSAPSRFRHVTLPMISPAILFNVVMATVWSLQVFAVPHIMTKGGPNDATLVYSMYVYRNAFEYGRMGYASALAWIQFVATVGITAVGLGLSRRLVYYRAA